MKKYGSLRFYWEGGYKRERLLRYVKSMVTQDTHLLSFPKSLFQKYYKDRFLQHVLNMDLDHNKRNDKEDIYIRYTQFRIYSKHEIIKTVIYKGDAISIIIGKNETINILYYNNQNDHSLCNIITKNNLGEIVNSIYITFLLLGSSKKIDKKLIKKKTFVNKWGLALPLKETETGLYMYYIITDD